MSPIPFVQYEIADERRSAISALRYRYRLLKLVRRVSVDGVGIRGRLSLSETCSCF